MHSIRAAVVATVAAAGMLAAAAAAAQAGQLHVLPAYDGVTAPVATGTEAPQRNTGEEIPS